MATSNNRSPSPNLARPNPNLRNSESNSSMRKSFCGNPFAKPSLFTNPRSFNPTTPANSPADLGRRKSLGKEGGISDLGRRTSVGKEGGISGRRYEEEKENESRKLEARVRSPARGTKNFMSPTISAASKFTPSPRKSVLAEKNIDSSVRTSISFSSDDNIQKDSELDLKSHMPSVTRNKLAVNHFVLEDASQQLQALSDSSLNESSYFEVPPSNSVPIENLCDELPLSSKTQDLSPSLSDLITESIDCVNAADPSLPPYDPTNNYLSPRPLFLRYKPNPRVELFINNQVLDFEDSNLKSEISSDTTDTISSEETQIEESSQEGSNDDSPSVEMEPNSDPPLVSEPIHQHTFEPTKIACKPPKFFTRTRSISLILGFLIACLCMSVTDTPVVGSPVFDPVSFYHSYDPFESVEFVKANFDGVFRHFKQWSSNSISYLSKMVLNFREVSEEISMFAYSNTSASHEDFLVVDDEFLNGLENVKGDEAEIVIEEHGEPEVEQMEQMTVRAELSDSCASPEVDLGAQRSSNDSNDDGEDLEKIIVQAELSDSYIPSEVALAAQQSNDEPHHNNEDLKIIEDQMGLELQACETEPQLEAVAAADASAAIEIEEFTNIDDFNGKNDFSTPALMTNFEEDLISEKSAEIVDPEVLVDNQQLLHVAKEKLSAGDVLLRHGVSAVILLAALLIVGSVSIIHIKMKSKASTDSVVDVGEKIYEDEVNDSSSTSRSTEESSSKRRAGVTKTTSEASYSQETSRSMKKINNPKRESLASSDFSMGSPSYGSFTTYERIPLHHNGSGDEQIVTPVRRSSRIRSKVTYS